MIVTKQLLSINHASTNQVLQMARILTSVLHKKVFLLVAGIAEDCELLEKNGLIIGTYQYNYNYALNGNFLYEYKGCSIPGYQLLIRKESVGEMRRVMHLIREMKPWFVWNIGGNTYYTGLIRNFTTYMYMKCSNGYPAVTADVIVNYFAAPSEEELQNKRYLEEQGMRVKEIRFSFPRQKPWQPAQRSAYGILENAFCLGVVGNRLEFDCSSEFLGVLADILDAMDDVWVLFYGAVDDKFKERMAERLDSTRVVSLGQKADLINYLGLMNLFINPPRLGGGASALMTMSLGIPVLTEGEGDIASFARPDFIVSGQEEFLPLVKKYRDDKDFMESQRRKVLQKMQEITTDDEKIGHILQQLIDMVGEAQV